MMQRIKEAARARWHSLPGRVQETLRLFYAVVAILIWVHFITFGGWPCAAQPSFEDMLTHWMPVCGCPTAAQIGAVPCDDPGTK